MVPACSQTQADTLVMSYRERVVAIGVAGVACLLGGCGGDESGSPTARRAALRERAPQERAAGGCGAVEIATSGT